MRAIPFAFAVAVFVVLAAIGMVAVPANVAGQTIPYPLTPYPTLDPLATLPPGNCGIADWCFPGPTETPEGATPVPTPTTAVDPSNPLAPTKTPFPVAPCPPLVQCFPALPRLVFLPRIVQPMP